MDPSYSTDLKRCTVDVERIGVDAFAFGFLCGVVTLTVLILSYGIAR